MREKAQKIAERMKKGAFDLDDLAEQLKQMQKLGGMSGMMGMLPGMGKIKKQLEGADLDNNVVEAPDGDHRLDDAVRAAQSQGHERLAQEARRGGLRHQGRGDQPAAQDASADGRHDEEDGPAARVACSARCSAAAGAPDEAEMEKMQAELARLDPNAIPPRTARTDGGRRRCRAPKAAPALPGLGGGQGLAGSRAASARSWRPRRSGASRGPGKKR